MTNLKKLTENLNLKILNSAEATNLKGGRKAKASNDYSYTPPPPKPVGGGAGIPPSLDNSTYSFI